jgi:hypothetical protein
MLTILGEENEVARIFTTFISSLKIREDGCSYTVGVEREAMAAGRSSTRLVVQLATWTALEIWGLAL